MTARSVPAMTAPRPVSVGVEATPPGHGKTRGKLANASEDDRLLLLEQSHDLCREKAREAVDLTGDRAVRLVGDRVRLEALLQTQGDERGLSSLRRWCDLGYSAGQWASRHGIEIPGEGWVSGDPETSPVALATHTAAQMLGNHGDFADLVEGAGRRIVLDEMPATPPRTLRVEQLADLEHYPHRIPHDRLREIDWLLTDAPALDAMSAIPTVSRRPPDRYGRDRAYVVAALQAVIDLAVEQVDPHPLYGAHITVGEAYDAARSEVHAARRALRKAKRDAVKRGETSTRQLRRARRRWRALREQRERVETIQDFIDRPLPPRSRAPAPGHAWIEVVPADLDDLLAATRAALQPLPFTPEPKVDSRIAGKVEWLESHNPIGAPSIALEEAQEALAEEVERVEAEEEQRARALAPHVQRRGAVWVIVAPDGSAHLEVHDRPLAHAFGDRDVTLLDSTAHPEVVAAEFGLGVEEVDIDRDPAQWDLREQDHTLVHLPVSTTRGSARSAAEDGYLGGYVAARIPWSRLVDGRAWGLIPPKHVREALDAALDAVYDGAEVEADPGLVEVWRQARRLGIVRPILLHAGACRGSNSMQDVGTLVLWTDGHTPNIGAATRRAEYLGVEARTYIGAVKDADLIQALGRARVWRRTGIEVIVAGKDVPVCISEHMGDPAITLDPVTSGPRARPALQVARDLGVGILDALGCALSPNRIRDLARLASRSPRVLDRLIRGMTDIESPAARAGLRALDMLDRRRLSGATRQLRQGVTRADGRRWDRWLGRLARWALRWLDLDTATRLGRTLLRTLRRVLDWSGGRLTDPENDPRGGGWDPSDGPAPRGSSP
mgnify:CR=1 FL=1